MAHKYGLKGDSMLLSLFIWVYLFITTTYMYVQENLNT